MSKYQDELRAAIHRYAMTYPAMREHAIKTNEYKDRKANLESLISRAIDIRALELALQASSSEMDKPIEYWLEKAQNDR